MPRKRHTKRKGGGTTREPARRPEEAKAKVVCLPVEVAKEEEEKQEGDGYDDYDYLEEGAETYLPWEVWVVVLDFVSFADLARFSMTCRLFNAIADMYPPSTIATPEHALCTSQLPHSNPT